MKNGMPEIPSLLLLALLTAGAPVAASADSLSVAQYLPGSDTGGEWEQLQPVQVYRGTELYDLVDGGAVRYEEYGFTAVAATSYAKKGGGAVSVELYEMKNEGAAFGIFTSVTGGLWKAGGKPGVIRFDGEYFLCFGEGRFFVTLTAQEVDRWDVSLAGSLLVEIQSRLPGPSGGVPLPVVILDSVFSSETSIVYMRGPIGLQSHAPSWYTRIAKGGEFGATRTGSMTTILAKTASEREAAEFVARLEVVPGLRFADSGAAPRAGTYEGRDTGVLPVTLGTAENWLVLAIGATPDSCASACSSVLDALRKRPVTPR
ncbi:MAG: hypothetical protein IT282_10915 [Bacteroidetes bacterium]|nr:hypothetical protein [Bacteroidota bacterium]